MNLRIKRAYIAVPRVRNCHCGGDVTHTRRLPRQRIFHSAGANPMNCVSNVYLIQHAAVETPGLIAAALKGRGIGIEMIRPFKGDRIPSRLGDHAGLVVMGGPMGVYEQDQYPFLKDEIRLIQQAVRAGKPVLGVCLGSQLLAAGVNGRQLITQAGRFLPELSAIGRTIFEGWASLVKGSPAPGRPRATDGA